MVLDTSGGLFSNRPLDNDDGMLKPRYFQDGVEFLNLSSFQLSASLTLRDNIPLTHRAYITDLYLQMRITPGASDYCQFTDGSSTKIEIFLGNAVAGDIIKLHFDTPLEFVTRVRYLELGTLNVNIALTGWIEPKQG